MATYSIADLSRLTGIKAHTIRTWELRFGLLKPERTETNIRFYDDGQLVKLLNVNTLLKSGLKISAISDLSENQISGEIEKATSRDDLKSELYELSIINFMNATLFYDEAAFEKEYAVAVEKFGVEGTFINVIYPLLNRLGMLWVQNKSSPAQEHFISNLIKQKLYVAIDSVSNGSSVSENTLLLLPEWEEHELGLLLSNLLFRKARKRVIHLGPKVPTSNIIDAIKYHNPARIFTILINNHKTQQVQELFDELDRTSPNLPIFITGNPLFLKHISFSKSCTWLHSFDDFGKAL